jgi:hypothetical protein
MKDTNTYTVVSIVTREDKRLVYGQRYEVKPVKDYDNFWRGSDGILYTKKSFTTIEKFRSMKLDILLK